MMFLIGALVGAYCFGTYALNFGMFLDTFDPDIKWYWRILDGLGYLASPVVVPIGIVLLAVVYKKS